MFDDAGDVSNTSSVIAAVDNSAHAGLNHGLVTWKVPHDPENPKEWSSRRKWTITWVMGSMTLVVSFASSVFSAATANTANEFHVSTEVTTLGTSLYILGFGVGPVVWGPASEFLGRRIPFFWSYVCFCIFQIPLGVATNLETIMLCRFFAGFFGTAPLAVTAGALADMFGPIDRGAALAVFTIATFVGPAAGPIVESFITSSSLGWRWTAWITLLMGSSFGIIGYIVIQETYAPVLLSRRAAKMRHKTKNWALHSSFDELRFDFQAVLTKYLLLPLRMLVQETILFLISLYLALVYSVLYLSLEAFPASFQKERNWSEGVWSLPFLSLLGGFIIGAVIIVMHTYGPYDRQYQASGVLPPESRLPPMMIGAIAFPLGLFWFAWTSFPRITWIPQVLAGIPIGIGIFVIFLQGISYIVDTYQVSANSAVAASTLVRGLMAAGFPMLANPMYGKLGIPWATTLLGCLALALLPVPFVFYKYGKTIRRSSRYCPD